MSSRNYMTFGEFTFFEAPSPRDFLLRKNTWSICHNLPGQQCIQQTGRSSSSLQRRGKIVNMEWGLQNDYRHAKCTKISTNLLFVSNKISTNKNINMHRISVKAPKTSVKHRVAKKQHKLVDCFLHLYIIVVMTKK